MSVNLPQTASEEQAEVPAWSSLLLFKHGGKRLFLPLFFTPSVQPHFFHTAGLPWVGLNSLIMHLDISVPVCPYNSTVLNTSTNITGGGGVEHDIKT